MNDSNNALCPCGSTRHYQQCCAPLHKYEQRAQSAEQLMRSRFSAFVLGDALYLLETLHPSKRQANELQLLENNIKSTQWLSLKVIHSSDNEVEFVAFYKASPFAQLHECSRFCQENKQWYYLDGQQLPPIKLERNENCPCGSRKKYKKCCL
ncbi:YchJ family protein [Agaribacterium sp. ZY112]|uniref:YchJ family protein n=1 Tax=Agaribacterium sp. ZY112 TaxID=3233574 RepID=UPI00352343D0